MIYSYVSSEDSHRFDLVNNYKKYWTQDTVWRNTNEYREQGESRSFNKNSLSMISNEIVLRMTPVTPYASSLQINRL